MDNRVNEDRAAKPKTQDCWITAIKVTIFAQFDGPVATHTTRVQSDNLAPSLPAVMPAGIRFIFRRVK